MGIGISAWSARQSHYSWARAKEDLKRLNDGSLSKDNVWKLDHDRAALDAAVVGWNARLDSMAAAGFLGGIASVLQNRVAPRGLAVTAFVLTAVGAGLNYVREKEPDWVRWLASSNSSPNPKSTHAGERMMALRHGGAALGLD